MTELVVALSGKWTLPVLYQLHLAQEPVRFGQLQRAVGEITQKELSKALRHLESLSLVERRQYTEIPPRVEYAVTSAGESLHVPMAALAAWLSQNPQTHARLLAARDDADLP